MTMTPPDGERSHGPDPDRMYWVARADGDDMFDEYSGYVVTAPDDWAVAEREAESNGEPTEYIITEWRRVVEHRRIIEPAAADRTTPTTWPERWLNIKPPDPPALP